MTEVPSRLRLAYHLKDGPTEEAQLTAYDLEKIKSVAKEFQKDFPTKQWVITFSYEVTPS